MSVIERRADWQAHFSVFARERIAMPFAWGQNDCCLFAADCVLAMTGADFAGEARGSYDDPRGAARLIAARGGLAQVATDALGDPVSPVMASVGDVVLLMHDGHEGLAICNGTSAIGPGPNGFVVLGMDTALAAWKV